MLLDHYQHQITNDFKKLLELEDVENSSKVFILIFLTIGMHIGLTRLLEVHPPNAEYDLEWRLCEGYIGVN